MEKLYIGKRTTNLTDIYDNEKTKKLEGIWVRDRKHIPIRKIAEHFKQKDEQ